MSQAPGSGAPHLRWKPPGRRSRKAGRPNIFSGLNLQQLQRLFRGAGEPDPEHRARLVWPGSQEDLQEEGGGREEEEEEEEEGRDEAGLAQALLGLRVRARNKAGFRAAGPREHQRLKASGYLRIPEPLSGRTAGDTDQSPADDDADDDDTDADVCRNQNPCSPPCWWRLDVARQPERYLHRVLR